MAFNKAEGIFTEEVQEFIEEPLDAWQTQCFQESLNSGLSSEIKLEESCQSDHESFPTDHQVLQLDIIPRNKS